MCGGGFIFIFSRSNYAESLLVALPLHLTFCRFASARNEVAQMCCYAPEGKVWFIKILSEGI